MVDLFEATYSEKMGQLVVDLDGARFILKELPKKEQLDITTENRRFLPLNMSFYLSTNDRDLLNDFEERFEFFLFKESYGSLVREKISRLTEGELEGIILFDDDGRSWSILYEADLEKYSDGPSA